METEKKSVDWAQVREAVEKGRLAVEETFVPSAEKTEKVLGERAKRLAGRRETVATPDSESQIIVFSVNESRYGIDLSRLSGVIPSRRLEAVPGAPAEVAGVVAVKGEVYVVLSLPELFGFAGAPAGAGSQEGHVLLLSRDKMRVGLWADGLAGVDYVDTKISGSGREYVKPRHSAELSHIEVDSIFSHSIFQEEKQ